MNTLTTTAPCERRITVERLEHVLERTLHEITVPEDVPDDQVKQWALARFAAGELPPPIGLAHTMLAGDASAAVRAITWHGPGDAPPASRDYIVSANESPADLALRFTSPDGMTLTLTGLTCAQVTYDWVRAGDEGEHIAAFAQDGEIHAHDAARPGGPTWVARFARAARALGGRFTCVDVRPGDLVLDVTLAAGNDEDENLTIGETDPFRVAGGVVISADGLRLPDSRQTNATLLVARDRDGDYWSFKSDSARYSDVDIRASRAAHAQDVRR